MDIKSMLIEAGIYQEWMKGHEIMEVTMSSLERFAALVAAHEREACAKVCDEWNWSSEHGAHPSSQLAAVAASIRSRGEK